jgi:hypothetical protein
MEVRKYDVDMMWACVRVVAIDKCIYSNVAAVSEFRRWPLFGRSDVWNIAGKEQMK